MENKQAKLTHKKIMVYQKVSEISTDWEMYVFFSNSTHTETLDLILLSLGQNNTSQAIVPTEKYKILLLSCFCHPYYPSPDPSYVKTPAVSLRFAFSCGVELWITCGCEAGYVAGGVAREHPDGEGSRSISAWFQRVRKLALHSPRGATAPAPPLLALESPLPYSQKSGDENLYRMGL